MMNELQNNFYLDCIPLELRLLLGEHYDHEIGEHDLLYLGRQNLDYLVGWWDDFAKKCKAYSLQLTEIYDALEDAKKRIDAVGSFESGEDIQAFEKLLNRSLRAKDSLCSQTTHAEQRHEYLARIVEGAEEKPLIFDQLPYEQGEFVTLFLADTSFDFGAKPQFVYGRIGHMSNLYVGGVVAAVNDEQMIIKTEQNLFVQGFSTSEIPVSVKSLGLMKTEDYEYFRKDLRYFEMYLNSRIEMTPNVKEAILTMVCAIKTKQ